MSSDNQQPACENVNSIGSWMWKCFFSYVLTADSLFPLVRLSVVGTLNHQVDGSFSAFNIAVDLINELCGIVFCRGIWWKVLVGQCDYCMRKFDVSLTGVSFIGHKRAKNYSEAFAER